MVLLAGRQAFRLCASGQLAAGDTGVSSLLFDLIISLSLGWVLGRIRSVAVAALGSVAGSGARKCSKALASARSGFRVGGAKCGST